MQCFRKLLVAKKFMDKREGEVSRFPSKNFCLTVSKKFVGEPFRVSLIRVSENFMLQRVISRLSVENFCLTVPKKFVGEPFRVSLIRVSENSMLQRVTSRISVENFLSHSAEKFRRGTL